MNKVKLILTLVSLHLLIQSCQKSKDYPSNLKPTYSDFNNDLEKLNLFEEVKSIKQFRANYENSVNKKNDVVSEIEFTKFGNIKVKKLYGDNGKLSQIDSFAYDSNNQITSMTSDMIYAETKFISKIENTENGKIENQKFYSDKELIKANEMLYDKKENLKKMISIRYEGGIKDTTITKFKYKLKDDKIIYQEAKVKDFGGWKTQEVYNFKYNEDGNLLTQSYNDKISQRKMIDSTEWKNQKLIKKIYYNNLNASKVALKTEVKYDDIFNPLVEKHFNSSYELRYTYNYYDRVGNWIERVIYRKDGKSTSNYFNPIYLEKRTIEYW